jgi:hypothetical protein
MLKIQKKTLLLDAVLSYYAVVNSQSPEGENL